ncbi:MAG: septum formation initiator family protein [Actinomycetes bacterium]|jgi:cell division protein FtsL|nr:MAG: septation ring formation regulator EzrA [Actinomycetota bacterium]
MRFIRRPWVAVTTLLILLLGIAFLTQVIPYRQIMEANQEVTRARERLAALEAENAELEQQVAALDTPTEIEKLAREKLGYVRPGEVAFVVVDPPGADDEPPAPEPEPEEPERSWLERVWDFVTGADIGDDG